MLAIAGSIVVAFTVLRGDETVSVRAALSETRGQGFDAVIWRATPAMRRTAEEIAERTGTEVPHLSGDGDVVLLRGVRSQT